MFAVVYIADFALQAVLRLKELSVDSTPAAVIDPTIPKTPIFQLTESARRAGIIEGMTATQATARCANIVIFTRSESLERSAMDALLDCAGCFSPDIEATAEGVVTLDLKGFRNISFENYAGKMVEHARRLRMNAQVGVAKTPLLALYAARSAKPVQAIEENSEATSRAAAEFLKPLPIEAIEPLSETLRILKQWGIHTIGSFLALDREAVCERLGDEGNDLFERALGGESRPLNLVRPPERFEEAIEFEHEIETAEPLLFVLRRFVEQIAARMEMSGKAAETLTLRLRFSRGPDHEHLFKVPEPTSHPDVLFRMLHTHLEDFKSEHPIVGLQLSGRPCDARRRQLGIFESSLRDPNRFGETLSRLAALVGSDHVGSPALLPSHRPDAFEMQPVNFETQSRGSGHESAQTSAQHALPLRRFRPPIPARVEMDGEHPALVNTPQFTQRIREARGPWRSSGDWWDNESWSRDEWDVQTLDGSLYRLFEANGEWFVEGVYD